MPLGTAVQQVGVPGFRKETIEAIPVGDDGDVIDSWVFRRDALDGPAEGRLILVHGLGDAPVTWFPSLRSTFPRYELILPALPGAGRGPLPEWLDHLPFPATADWLRHVLQIFADRSLRTRIIGHSMGGWLVARAYLADPTLVDRAGPPVLINNAGTWYPGVERERTLLSPKRLEDVDELLAHLYADAPELPIEALQAMLDTMRAPSYHGLLASTTTNDMLQPEDLARLPPQTAVVWGTEDRLVPLEALARLEANIPDVHIVRLDGIGHAPHLEAPGRLVEALDDLLQGHAQTLGT